MDGEARCWLVLQYAHEWVTQCVMRHAAWQGAEAHARGSKQQECRISGACGLLSKESVWGPGRQARLAAALAA